MTQASQTTSPRRRRRQRRQGQRWLWLGAGLVLALVGFASWYFIFRAEDPTNTEVTGPETLAVFPQVFRETVSGTGTLAPARTLEVSFDVAGTVTSIAEVGQRVNAGDVLARLESTSFERSVRDAEVSLAQAQSRLDSTASSQTDSQVSLQESIQGAQLGIQDASREVTRTQSELDLSQKLYAVGSESRENLQLAQDNHNRALETLAKAELNLNTLQESQQLRTSANQQDLYNTELSVQAAQLGLERAQEDLDATILRADFAGVISEVYVTTGNSVSSSSAVLSLIDDSQLLLEAQVDETEIALLELGFNAEVSLDAVPDQSFTGRVSTISPMARLVSNIPIFDVTITLDNQQGLMRPGMTAEAEVLVQEVENTVSVPSRAIQQVRTRSYLQVLSEDGSFALQPIQVITTSGLNTIVQTTLAPGSEVLVPELVSAERSTTEAPRGTGIPFLGGPPR